MTTQRQVDFYHREGYLIPKALVLPEKSGELQLNMKIPDFLFEEFAIPIGSMVMVYFGGVFTYMWPIFLVNVGKIR